MWDIAAAIEITAENFGAGDICGTGRLTVKVRNGPKVTFGSAAVKHRMHARSERRRVVKSEDCGIVVDKTFLESRFLRFEMRPRPTLNANGVS